ncbi:MAG: hypothetical protein JXR11_11405 [Balneola sp.]
MSYQFYMVKSRYTIIDYNNLLQCLLNNEYEFILFPTRNKKVYPQNKIILRHDIDFSLIAAKEIATQNYLLGIKSTFFLYLNSTFYNITHKDDIKIINKIIELGHDIALHYDSNSYLNPTVELKILKEIFPTCRVDIISLHRPSTYLDKVKNINESLPPSIITTYDSRFIKEINYVSDSKCDLNFNYLKRIIDNKESLQLLLHPIWWYFKGKNVNHKLNKFYTERSMNISKLIKYNLSFKVNILDD